jgi:hypothetical protein
MASRTRRSVVQISGLFRLMTVFLLALIGPFTFVHNIFMCLCVRHMSFVWFTSERSCSRTITFTVGYLVHFSSDRSVSNFSRHTLCFISDFDGTLYHNFMHFSRSTRVSGRFGKETASNERHVSYEVTQCRIFKPSVSVDRLKRTRMSMHPSQLQQDILASSRTNSAGAYTHRIALSVPAF